MCLFENVIFALAPTPRINILYFIRRKSTLVVHINTFHIKAIFYMCYHYYSFSFLLLLLSLSLFLSFFLSLFNNTSCCINIIYIHNFIHHFIFLVTLLLIYYLPFVNLNNSFIQITFLEAIVNHLQFVLRMNSLLFLTFK